MIFSQFQNLKLDEQRLRLDPRPPGNRDRRPKTKWVIRFKYSEKEAATLAFNNMMERLEEESDEEDCEAAVLEPQDLTDDGFFSVQHMILVNMDQTENMGIVEGREPGASDFTGSVNQMDTVEEKKSRDSDFTTRGEVGETTEDWKPEDADSAQGDEEKDEVEIMEAEDFAPFPSMKPESDEVVEVQGIPTTSAGSFGAPEVSKDADCLGEVDSMFRSGPLIPFLVSSSSSEVSGAVPGAPERLQSQSSEGAFPTPSTACEPIPGKYLWARKINTQRIVGSRITTRHACALGCWGVASGKCPISYSFKKGMLESVEEGDERDSDGEPEDSKRYEDPEEQMDTNEVVEFEDRYPEDSKEPRDSDELMNSKDKELEDCKPDEDPDEQMDTSGFLDVEDQIGEDSRSLKGSEEHTETEEGSHKDREGFGASGETSMGHEVMMPTYATLSPGHLQTTAETSKDLNGSGAYGAPTQVEYLHTIPESIKSVQVPPRPPVNLAHHGRPTIFGTKLESAQAYFQNLLEAQKRRSVAWSSARSVTPRSPPAVSRGLSPFGSAGSPILKNRQSRKTTTPTESRSSTSVRNNGSSIHPTCGTTFQSTQKPKIAHNPKMMKLLALQSLGYTGSYDCALAGPESQTSQRQSSMLGATPSVLFNDVQTSQGLEDYRPSTSGQNGNRFLAVPPGVHGAVYRESESPHLQDSGAQNQASCISEAAEGFGPQHESGGPPNPSESFGADSEIHGAQQVSMDLDYYADQISSRLDSQQVQEYETPASSAQYFQPANGAQEHGYYRIPDTNAFRQAAPPTSSSSNQWEAEEEYTPQMDRWAHFEEEVTAQPAHQNTVEGFQPDTAPAPPLSRSGGTLEVLERSEKSESHQNTSIREEIGRKWKEVSGQELRVSHKDSEASSRIRESYDAPMDPEIEESEVRDSESVKEESEVEIKNLEGRAESSFRSDAPKNSTDEDSKTPEEDPESSGKEPGELSSSDDSSDSDDDSDAPNSSTGNSGDSKTHEEDPAESKSPESRHDDSEAQRRHSGTQNRHLSNLGLEMSSSDSDEF